MEKHWKFENLGSNIILNCLFILKYRGGDTSKQVMGLIVKEASHNGVQEKPKNTL